MTISLDPTLPVSRVRMSIGDATEPFILADPIIQYLLDTSSSEATATLKALEYAMASTLKDIDSETYEVQARCSQLYDHFKARYDQLKKDTELAGAAGLFYFGGTSKAEMKRVRDNSDSNLPPVQAGSWDTSAKSVTNDLDNYSFLEGDCY